MKVPAFDPMQIATHLMNFLWRGTPLKAATQCTPRGEEKQIMQVQRATRAWQDAANDRGTPTRGDAHAITLRILVLDLPGEWRHAGQRPNRLRTKEGGGEKGERERGVDRSLRFPPP